MREFIERHIEKHLTGNPGTSGFWKEPQMSLQAISEDQWLAHADYIYIQHYLGTLSGVSRAAAEQFAKSVAQAPLFGTPTNRKPLLPHLSAYLLGAINLLAQAGHDFRADALGEIDIKTELLINPQTLLPRWPKAWSHHIWRVSHWVGGIPAIMLTFARHDPRQRIGETDVQNVLNACDRALLSPSDGLMRTYKSALLQKLFRTAYKVRHNPEHADIGGLVHLHWINDIMKRRYIGAESLVARCLRDMKKAPFMEPVPYCLDFDYLFLLRTGLMQTGKGITPEAKGMGQSYLSALRSFFRNMPEDYSVHKLAGALASLHEAALLAEDHPFEDSPQAPIDIIKEAYWI